MTLSGLAYMPTRPRTGIPRHLADPSLATRGEWSVAWGPAERLGNLAFVAHHPERNVFAVVIRGTRPLPGGTFLLNLYENLRVGEMVPWAPSTVPGAAVARGTNRGIRNLLALASKQVTLEAFVRDRVAPSGATLVVTGHSLGGCLATVLAPWLRHRFGAALEIECVTFAAPTAGNAAFGEYFRSLFPRAERYVNTIDFVPMAWETLADIGTLFPAPGRPCTPMIRASLKKITKLLAETGVSYAQPSPATMLPGTPRNRFFEIEAFMQHHPDAYLELLGAPGLPFDLFGISFKGIDAKLPARLG
ncbi:MAG TPA: lipase family protein [Longimicrobium sp.]|nr:lipase family protein [Longimicrobium sp.]